MHNFCYLIVAGSDAGKDFGRWQVADACGVIQNELSETVVTQSGTSADVIFGPKPDLTPSNLSHTSSAGELPLN